MSRLRLSLANDIGQVEHVRLHEVLPGTAPLRLPLKAGQKIFMQVDGRQQTGQELVLGKRPVLRKQGNDLIMEVDGASLVELVDFYATDEVSLSGDAWTFDGDLGLVVAGGAVFALSAGELAAVGISGTGNGKDLAAAGMSGTGRDLAGVGVSGTGQDLAAVGVSGTGTGKDLAAVGVSGTGTGKDLAAVGMSGTGQDLAAVGVSGTSQDLAAVGVSGTGQDLAAVGVSGSGRDLAAVGLSGTGRDLASIGITGTGVNTWMAGISMLPLIGSLDGGDSTGSASVVRGSVVAGPVTQGLEVQLFKLEGGRWVAMEDRAVVQAGGSWTYVVKGYTGPLVAKVIDTNDQDGHGNTNYISELTRQEVDIQATLMTAFNLESGTKTVQINALTTIAAMKAGLKINAEGGFEQPAADFGATTIDNSNRAVAEVCGLTDLVSGDVKAVIQSNGNNNAGANEYGKLVAAIEGAGGNDDAVLKRFADELVMDGGEARLNQWYKNQLVIGASKVEDVLGFVGMTGVVGEMLTRAYSHKDIQIAAIGGNGIVDDSERENLSISVTITLPAASVRVSLDGQSVTPTWLSQVNGTWQIGLPAHASIHGAHEIKVEALSATGALLGATSRLYRAIDTTAPVIAQAVLSGQDGLGNDKNTPLLAGDKIKVTLTTSEAVAGWTSGDTVSITVGGAMRDAVYTGSNGNAHHFTYTIAPGELDLDGGVALGGLSFAQVSDVAGNRLSSVLPAQTNTVAVDAVAPTIAQALVGGVDAANNAKTGVLVAGDKIKVTLTTSEAVAGWTSGDTVSVTVGGVVRDAAYTGSNGNAHHFTYTIAPGELDLDGGVALGGLSFAQVSDVAGNRLNSVLPAQTNTVAVDAVAPTIAQALVGGVDAANNAKTGTLVAGDKIKVTLTTSEAVAGWTSGDTVSITVGGAMRDAVYTGSNGNAHHFTYTIAQGDLDLDGGVALGSLNFAQVSDVAGNRLNSVLPAQTNTVAVDAVAPTISQALVGGVDAANNAKTGTLVAGDKIKVTLTTSEAVAGWTSGDTVSITVGGAVRDAVYAGSSGNTHDFTYTIVQGDLDLQGGIALGTLSVALVTDAVGNGLLTALPEQNNAVVVDAFVTTAAVTGVIDDFGRVQGVVTTGKKTDDNNLTVTGSIAQALTAGDVIKIYDGDLELSGELTFLTDTLWTFRDTRTLNPGQTVSYRAKVHDVAGNVGTQGEAYSVTVTIPLGATLSVTANNANGGYDGVASDDGISADAFVGLTTVAGADGNDRLVITSAVQATQLTVLGEAGNDTIQVSAAVSGFGSIDGGLGNDSITYAGSHSGNSTLFGGEGNDTIVFSGTNSAALKAVGGPGTDSIAYSGSASVGLNVTQLNAAGGFDGNFGTSANNTGSFSFEGFERFTLGNGNDTASVNANVSNLTVDTGSGDDLLNATAMTSGSVSVVAGSGSDTIMLGAGADTVYASRETVLGNDSFSGGAGTDLLRYDDHTGSLTLSITGAGVDGGVSGSVTGASSVGTDSFTGFERLWGGKGNDTFVMTTPIGFVSIDGSQGDDVLSYASHTAGLIVNVTTNSGGHVIKTNNGISATDSFFAIESMVAGSGNDTISMAASVTGGMWVEDGLGSDAITLGSGNDTLRTTLETSLGNDSYSGGAGVDELSYTAQTAALSVSITSSNPNGGVDGLVFAQHGVDVFQGFEVLRLGSGNDSVTFSAISATLTLFGGDGNDIINASAMVSGALAVTGGFGDDSITFGAGNDTMNAQTGPDNDTFVGGTGTDVLSYAAQSAALVALITQAHPDGGASGVVQTPTGDYADNFSGFENLVGSSGNDTFTVSASVGHLSLNGGAGDDLFNALSSANGMHWNGALGNDTLSHAASSSGHSYSISAVNAVGGMDGAIVASGTSSVFSSMESIVGGSGNDTFTVSVNVGNVTLNGGAGHDTFSFVAIDPAANGAGFGGMTVAAFDWSQDALNLHGFWSAGVVKQNNLNEYVQMNGDLLQVDMDGAGAVFSMTTVAMFSAQQNFSSLSAMFATDRLTITSILEPVIPT